MEPETLLSEAERLARHLLGQGFAHGYPHVERVRRYAWEIVEAESLRVDRLVLELAVTLHDAGRPLGEPHARLSARLAESFLRDRLDGERLARVVNAILYHSYSYARRARVEPLGPEALVLSDADKLDALGATGFLRVFLHGCEAGRGFEESLAHFDEKIFRLPGLMHYQYSRRLARELARRTRLLLEQLLVEARPAPRPRENG